MLTRRLFTQTALAVSALALARPVKAQLLVPKLGDEIQLSFESLLALPPGTLVAVEHADMQWWYLTTANAHSVVCTDDGGERVVRDLCITQRFGFDGSPYSTLSKMWIIWPEARGFIRAFDVPDEPLAVMAAIKPHVRIVHISEKYTMTWTLRDTDPNAIVAGFNKATARRAAAPMRSALAMVRPL